MTSILFPDGPSFAEVRALMTDATPAEIPESPALRRAIRVRAGIPMTTAARALNVVPLTVARWELEGRKPQRAHAESYGLLLAVCRAIAEPTDAALREVP